MNPENKVLNHEEVYHGKIVDLHVDTIQQASGKSAIREVVLHPGGVVAVPVLDDGNLAFVHQFRYPLKKYILEFPAGKMEKHLSAEETIAKELEEEIGYRAGTLSHECSFYTSPGISTELIHLFVARDLKPVPQHLEEGEHIIVKKYNLEQCLDLLGQGEVGDGKTLLGLLWYLRKIEMK